MKVYEVRVPGQETEDEISVQVREDGVALNLYADGTAGVPEDIRKAAEEYFVPEDCPVIGQDDASYNPGKPGHTWDDLFKPDSYTPAFHAEVSDDTMLSVEWDEGWHLWQITKIDGEPRGHHHLAGPFFWTPDVQEQAVKAFERLADEQAKSGPVESGEVVNQTFNIGEDDETDALVMYGVPRHEFDNPTALRRHLLNLYTDRERALATLMTLLPFARERALYLKAYPTTANAAKEKRFEAAEASCRDLGVPMKESE